MRTKSEILARARDAVKEHTAVLKALRKKNKTKRRSKMSVAYPHFIYELEKPASGKTSIKLRGIQCMLAEGDIPIGTVVFAKAKRGFRFSHFSFNRAASRVLVTSIKAITKKWKVPGEQLPELVSALLFGRSFLRLKVDRRFVYVEVDGKKKLRIIPQDEIVKDFENNIDAARQDELNFMAEKNQAKENKIERLQQLDYL